MVNCLLYRTFGYEFEFRTSKYLYFDMSLDFPLPLEFCPPPPLPRRMILPTRYVSLRNVGRRNESTRTGEISAISIFDPLKLVFSWFFYIVRFIVVSFTKFILKIDHWMRVRDAICAWTRECKICRLGPAYFFVLAHFFHVSNQSLELKESLFKLICEHPMIRINFNEILICSSKHLT